MENNQSLKEKYLKLNFLKKIWYSIVKFEKYPEMAALGVKQALIYFTKLVLIFSIIYAGAFIYHVSKKPEYNEQNLSLSQRLVTEMVDETNYSEKLNNAADLVKQEGSKSIIIALFIGIFIALFITFLLDVFTLSLFGLITCFVARIKINYKALFNMSIFALTLAMILRTIYFVLNLLTNFEIKYFDVMYVAISYISLLAAIFIIKSNVIKQHLELMKIIEESKDKIEDTLSNLKKTKDEEEDEESEKEEKKEDEEGPEGQGSNA